MRTMRLLGLAGVMLAAGSWMTADAQGRGRGNSRSQDRDGARVDASVDVSIGFGSGELRLIRSWFGDSHNREGLPPGLAKRDSLPPGLQRQLRKNGTLPPGLEGHVHAVPVDLNRRLPDLRSGTSRLIIGGSIVLVDDSSKVILDIAAIF